jgi:hypothetical protein
MLSDTITLPVEFPEAFQAFTQISGIIQANAQEIVLEYEVKDAFVGLLKSDIKSVHVPLVELTEVSLRKGWFRTRVTLRAKSLQTLAKAPGHNKGEICFSVARKDRPLAEQLVSFLNLRICERDLREMGERLDRASPASGKSDLGV